MDTNDINMQELDELRRQVAAFRERLDRQQIVGDRMVRHTMQQRMAWIRNFIWAEVIAAPIILLAMAAVTAFFGLPWLCFLFFAFCLTADKVADFRINLTKRADLRSGNLIDVARHLRWQKRARTIQAAISLPLVFVWAVWFCTSLHASALRMQGIAPADAHAFGNGIIMGGIIGALIGIGIALRIYLRMQRSNDEVIHQIEELTDGEAE